MKHFIISLLASIVAVTSAVPLEKRVLIIETVTDIEVKTIDVTTTIWVKPSAQAHINQHAHHAAHKHPAPAPAPAPAPVPVPAYPKSSPEAAGAVAKQPAPAPVLATLPTKQAAPVVQQAAKAAAPQPAAPVIQAPSPPAPSPQPPSSPAPIAQANTNINTGGSTANCGKVGMPCSGDITFYDTGLGACGWTNDGTTENVFALAHEMMGDQSNGNPFCGRQAEISLNGKTVTGKLVDKCGGCGGQSIDLSHKLFQALASEDKGRIGDVSWKFID
ncbi:MAG: hypothetical protein Q9220_004212 [cf. Caloplaca sp. 1 TL-2023]